MTLAINVLPSRRISGSGVGMTCCLETFLPEGVGKLTRNPFSQEVVTGPPSRPSLPQPGPSASQWELSHILVGGVPEEDGGELLSGGEELNVPPRLLRGPLTPQPQVRPRAAVRRRWPSGAQPVGLRGGFGPHPSSPAGETEAWVEGAVCSRSGCCAG